MAIIANTVQDILEYISDLRGESSTISDDSRIRAVSRAGNDFSRRMLFSFYIQPNQTVVGDGITQDFTIGSTTLPCREKGLDEVFVGDLSEGSRYEVVDYNEYKLKFNKDNGQRLVYQWYDATNDLWKMHINPIPPNSVIIYYSYYFQQADVTSTSDIVYCPDQTIIAQMALADIYHAEDELEKETQQNQEVEDLITEVIGIENMPNRGQLHTVTPIEQNVKRPGLGNY